MRTVGKYVAITFLLASPAFMLLAQTPAPAVAPPLRLSIGSLKPDATIESSGERHMAIAPAGVWLTNRSLGTVTLIDAATNKPGTPIDVGEGPCHGVLVAFKSVWTPLCDEPGLARADISSEKPSVIIVPTGRTGAGPLVSGTGSVWMISDRAGTLSRIDPDTNAIVAEVTVPGGAGAIGFGQDAVWVTSSRGATGHVSRINGYSNVVTDTIKVGAAPSGVAIGEGSVWTWNAGDGSVSRLDPKTNKVTETIKTGVKSTGGAIAVGEGSVWVSAPGAPLIRIDPLTNQLAQLFSGPGGGVITIGHGSLWVTATPTAIWRVDPKRVVATRK